MPLIAVREAKSGDFAALLRLLDEMDESMYPGRGHAGEGDIRALYEAILADRDQRLLVAEVGGRASLPLGRRMWGWATISHDAEIVHYSVPPHKRKRWWRIARGEKKDAK